MEPEEVASNGGEGAADATADGTADGTAAVLYAIFTSFTESLGELEHRLAAIESAVQRPAAELAERLEAVEAAPAAGRALAELVERRADAVEARLARLEEALASLRSLLQDHADDTAHSLGRRAGDVGRRLATDLGFRPRRGEQGRT